MAVSIAVLALFVGVTAFAHPLAGWVGSVLTAIELSWMAGEPIWIP